MLLKGKHTKKLKQKPKRDKTVTESTENRLENFDQFPLLIRK